MADVSAASGAGMDVSGCSSSSDRNSINASWRRPNPQARPQGFERTSWFSGAIDRAIAKHRRHHQLFPYGEQNALFDQSVKMLWCEFEHPVQMTNRPFQAPPFCGDPRQQQKNFGLVIAMGQELQILFFCLLEISTGMMSRSAPQELKENWKSSLCSDRPPCPAFTLDDAERSSTRKGHVSTDYASPRLKLRPSGKIHTDIPAPPDRFDSP